MCHRPEFSGADGGACDDREAAHPERMTLTEPTRSARMKGDRVMAMSCVPARRSCQYSSAVTCHPGQSEGSALCVASHRFFASLRNDADVHVFALFLHPNSCTTSSLLKYLIHFLLLI